MMGTTFARSQATQLGSMGSWKVAELSNGKGAAIGPVSGH